ncbi:type II secretion system minor pseudopilin GspK [Salinisphaera hydrothermalis]|uniref:Type II secretion system protein K n=1 Tax=Salinisphaera hydrothermalis (strain C41B8) TaxID=1304275 RepID=A0A084IQP7_SALHC|nr:type II secretion system minor pseudopilin GspK [Salinisphaera hydrothermalis]KEZ79031.1 general secretion pathway protein K [Salinisphaera hydrothermalis C41B8]
MTAPRSQRGIALLTAMLIVALAAIISAAMISRMTLAMHRSGNIWNAEQAWWYGIGIENWLGTKLREDARHSKTDNLQELWARPVDYLPIDGGSISGQIIDLQGRFNLNNLVLGDPKTSEAEFVRLIQAVSDTDEVTARTIAQSAHDWIDSDINPTRPYGAEDDYYLGLSPAYRTGNTLMVSPSELRAVRGMTPLLYRELAPYISALPTATAINVDTAPAPVLQAIAQLPQGTGKKLVAMRSGSPWQSIKSFRAANPLAGRDTDKASLSVSTQYFLVAGRIKVGDGTTQFYSVLHRDSSGAVNVIRQATGAY